MFENLSFSPHVKCTNEQSKIEVDMVECGMWVKEVVGYVVEAMLPNAGLAGLALYCISNLMRSCCKRNCGTIRSRVRVAKNQVTVIEFAQCLLPSNIHQFPCYLEFRFAEPCGKSAASNMLFVLVSMQNMGGVHNFAALATIF